MIRELALLPVLVLMVIAYYAGRVIGSYLIRALGETV